MNIRFGPAGNSESFTLAGYKKTADAPEYISKMGLTAFEYQCGRGIRIKPETAQLIGENAKKFNVKMSLHTPYFINLSSIEKTEKNIEYVLNSANVCRHLGADRMVVHCGGLSKKTRIKAMENTKENLKNILNALEENNLSDISMCIETMGKINVLGDLDEVCQIVSTDERLLPCIDFGHINSRTMGSLKEYDDYDNIFKTLENSIGFSRTNIFHGHFSKIEYSEKGEIRHLNFTDTVYGPEFEPLAKVLVDRKYSPTIICECANTQAEDAKTMLDIYNSYNK